MFIELVGHRIGIWVTCIVSFIGIIVECTSGPMGQFVVGRIIVYFSVGMAEVCVTYVSMSQRVVSDAYRDLTSFIVHTRQSLYRPVQEELL